MDPFGPALLGERVERALLAGLDRLVVREVQLPPWGEAVATAEPVRVVLHARMAGAATVAARVGCGLHLPSTESVRAWRRRFAGALGVSVHSEDDALRALDVGAAYVFLSPIWQAGSKPGDTRAPLGTVCLERLAGRRVVALGGLTPERAATCARLGVYGVASLGGIFGAEDPGVAVGDLRATMALALR